MSLIRRVRFSRHWDMAASSQRRRVAKGNSRISDLSTQRRLKLLFGSVTILALIISAYLSSVLLLINVSLFLLVGVYPLTESGQQNARGLMIISVQFCINGDKKIKECDLEEKYKDYLNKPGIRIFYDTDEDCPHS